MSGQKDYQGRGQLTGRVKAKSAEVLGREITRGELRFMAYAVDTLMNTQRFDLSRMSGEDVGIFNDWAISGVLTFKQNGKVTVTPDFWMAITDIVYLAYVDTTS